MDDEEVATIAAVLGACVAASIAAIDQRSIRLPSTKVSTFSTLTFEQAMAAPSTGWFHTKLRCDKSSFLKIYKLVASSTVRQPAPNSKHKLIKRVALTMLFLARGGTEDSAATILGVSRSRAVEYVNQVLDTLDCLSRQYIRMPTAAELPAVEAGFYRVGGFPGVVGAIDGTLIKIPRPADYEGWYSRKNYPALNVQAVVDSTGYFRSLSIRAGSTNDQSLWNGSGLRKR